MEPNNFKILLVDDEPDILEIVSYSLKNADYDVYTASNGLEAIKIAKKIETFFTKKVRAGYLATEAVEFLTPAPHYAVIVENVSPAFPQKAKGSAYFG